MYPFQVSTTILSRSMPRSSKRKRSNERQTRWFGRRKHSRGVKRSRPALTPKLEELNCVVSKEIYSVPLREGMIRLVTLCAGSHSDMVQCKLMETRLSRPTPTMPSLTYGDQRKIQSEYYWTLGSIKSPKTFLKRSKS